MRRSLILILALLPLSLLAACSSSDETTTSSSTTAAPATTTTTKKSTVSSVAVTPEDAELCAEVQAYQTARDAVPEITGGMTEANAVTIKEFLVGLEPMVTAIQDGAPAELQAWVTVTQNGATEVKALDVTVEADRQKLGALLLYPADDVKAANAEFAEFSATRCGIDLG